MRVNNNITAMMALRHLGNTTNDTKKSLEKLSSGMKINTAADGPASLMISENMRAQIAGIRQAADNSETSISMLQTAEGALQEVSSILINMRQLAIHAANDGANDRNMLEADQQEIDNLLDTLGRISQYTLFGTKKLLDGSNGTSGTTVGENIRFVSATTRTEPSPPEGHPIDITQVATRAKVSGKTAIDYQNAKEGFKFTINDGGQVAEFSTRRGDVQETINKLIQNMERSAQDDPNASPETVNQTIREVVARSFQRSADEQGLKVDIYIDESGMLTVRHKEFGSDPSFTVTGDRDGFLSEKANIANSSEHGVDVAGFIGNYVSVGKGQMLTGGVGTPVEGLTVEYNKELGYERQEVIDQETGERVVRLVPQTSEQLIGGKVDGYVNVSQQSLRYQIGPNRGQDLRVDVESTHPTKLGRGVNNNSEFTSLADIDVRSGAQASDAIAVVDQAIEEVAQLRGKLGAIQKNALETTLSYLKMADENLTNAESIIRDTDMADEMSNFTKNQIMLASGTAMAAQANQVPKSVMQLLSGLNS